MIKNYKLWIGAVVLFLFLWQLYQKIFNAAEGFGRRGITAAVAVEIAPVQKTSITDLGQFTGTLFPRSQFTVAPKITGRLEKIFVNIGDPVTFNQLIARLDDDESAQQAERSQAELEVAKANVEEAKSAFEVAKRDLDRVAALRKRELVSESDLDIADGRFKTQEARYKVSLAQVTQREAALREALVRLSYTKILAAWEENGDKNATRVVGERFVDEGTLLTPSTPIATILDINTLIAVIHIVEQDYPKIKIGQEAILTNDAFRGRTFTGKIVRIAPILRESSREARIEIEILNSELILKPGMFIRAEIIFNRHDRATVVPTAALTRREDKRGVFLADTQNNVAHFVPVAVGIANADVVEILDPAMSGYVVTVGHHLLEDGAAITVPASKSDRGGETQVSRDQSNTTGQQSPGRGVAQ